MLLEMDINSEEAVAPVIVPLVFWISSYIYCNHQHAVTSGSESSSSTTKEVDNSSSISSATKPEARQKPHPPFHKWHLIHNIHNFGAILLGCLALAVADSTVYNERIGILWSLTYFVVDIFDCSIRGDTVYLLHGLACFGLGCGNYWTPASRQLRLNSKATFCECSNPFMHLSKRTRNPWHFALFAAVYTVCRIVWLPIIMYQMYTIGNMGWWGDKASVWLYGVAGFYVLNWFWYIKIWNILLTGGRQNKKKEAESDQKEN